MFAAYDRELAVPACALSTTRQNEFRACPTLPYKVGWIAATGTGRMKKRAPVAALAAFASLAPAFAVKEALVDSPKLAVSCDNEGKVTATPPGPIRITKPKTTLTLTCLSNYTAKPDPAGGTPKVYKSVECAPPEEALETHCPGAKGELVSGHKYQLELYFPTVPTKLNEFYLKCEPPKGGKACPVHVLVNSTPEPDEHESGDGLGGGVGQGQGQGGQAGTAGVQTCVHSTKTITVRIPAKGSVAQFACESGSTLYPVEPDKVFSKDCKKQETLKDMTRTRTPAATSVPGSHGSRGGESPTYTLKADKTPAKKTLCYLCATAGTSVDEPGTAANYCTVYVESGAGARYSLTFIVALVLPCVLAELQFT